MLYMKAGQKAIVVLETANLEELKKGRPATTPDKSIIIAWTADPVWLADKIIDTKGDAAEIAKLINEAAKRPEKPVGRPYHQAAHRGIRQARFPGKERAGGNALA